MIINRAFMGVRMEEAQKIADRQKDLQHSIYEPVLKTFYAKASKQGQGWIQSWTLGGLNYHFHVKSVLTLLFAIGNIAV